MKHSRRFGLRLLFFAVVCLLAASPSKAQLQGPQVRVTQRVDETNRITLRGNTHPLARPEFDQGAAPDALPMNRMLLVLKRSFEQESALQTLLDAQQDKSSPSYHQWLSPDQFGQQFGPSDQDLQTVTSWLASHGFQVARVATGRAAIEFSGTAAQVRQAFNTEIHQYVVNGESHWANASDPQIPTALAPVVAGINSLHNFLKTPTYRLDGIFSKSRTTGEVRPLAPDFTFTDPSICGANGTCYMVGPYDFAKIYNVLPLWSANPAIDGTGQAIAIVGESNINIQDVRDFRALFGLPVNDPQIILDGPDPGIVPGDEGEADLDVEWSGAVAKRATIKFVVSESTNSSAGIDLSALYIVDNNVAPVASESYGDCELFLGTSGNSFQNAIREQAAAQGITFINSSGDEGSARCDPYNSNALIHTATHGLMVSGLASSPFGVAVGGTDFMNFGPGFNYHSPSPYWNSGNGANEASALGYIPESTWNDSCTNSIFISLGYGNSPEVACNNPQAQNWLETVAGGGGASNCTTSDSTNPSSCSGGYAKPAWQTGPGVPSDGARDIPDVSLFASSGFIGSAYVICEADQVPPGASCNLNSPYSDFVGIGGTSAAAASFAALMALVNQYTQSSGQGNPNYVLYKLPVLPSQTTLNCNSSTNPDSRCVLHDVTSGTIAVPCSAGSPNCNVSTPGDSFGLLAGYNAGSGYDLATGLGTVNATNLVHNWNAVTFTPSATTLILNNGSGINITHGQSVPVSIAVTGGGTTPTGDVSLIGNPGGAAAVGIDRFTLSNGNASSATHFLPGGTYAVKAHYEGDGTYGGSDSTPTMVTVIPENSTVRTSAFAADLNGNLSPLTSNVYGTAVYLRADVSTARTGSGIIDTPPTGTVTITDTFNGATTNVPGGTLSLNSSGYALTSQGSYTFAGGTHTVGATYGGDNSYMAAQTSTPSVFTITPASDFMLVSPTNGYVSVLGSSVTFGIVLETNSNGLPPTGSVAFFDNGVSMGSPVTLAGGYDTVTHFAQATASFSTTQIPLGSNSISIHYSGDPNYVISQATLPFSVLISTSTVVTSSISTVAQGTGVTLTANMIPAQGGGPAVGGEVSFRIGSNGLINGIVPVVNGQAVMTANVAPNFLPTGTITVSADYKGDTNYAASTTGFTTGVTLTVNPAPGTDFALSAGTPSVTVTAPGNLSPPVTLTVTPVGGFDGTVSFTPSSCAIAPAGSLSSCSFSTSSVTGSGTTSVSIATTAPSFSTQAPSGGISRFQWPIAGAVVALVLFVLLAAFPARQRRWSAALGLAAVALLAAACLGCGGGSRSVSGSTGGSGGGSQVPGTPTGVLYTVTVTGTCGSLAHTASFTFTVQ